MAGRKKIKIPTLREIQRKFPTQYIAGEVDESKRPWLPTRFLAFNKVTGGGCPFGKIIELFGEESSGKSLMAYDFAYCCQYLGGMVLWVDAEQSFTNDWATKNGLDLDKIVVYRSTSIEAISDWVANMALYWRSQLTHNEPILLVLDSVSALDTDINLNSEMLNASADMGNRAKAIYKYFRIRNEMLYSLGITQVYVNQLRKNLKAGMFENPDCLHYDTEIPFVDGTHMKIGDIVRNRIQKDVWSFNETTEEWEAKSIVGWVEKEPTESWLSITARGIGTKNGVVGFKCTPNHQVLTESGWKFAKALTLEDKLVTKYKSVLYGNLLHFVKALTIGDASIRIRSKNTANIKLRDTNNQDYVKWKSSILSQALNMKVSGEYYTSEYSIEIALIKMGNPDRDPNKVFNTESFSWLSLAVWYMDDGSLYRDKQPCICIPSFRTDIEVLRKTLEERGLQTSYYSGKYLRFNADCIDYFFNNVKEYIHPSMYYKLPIKYRGYFKANNFEYTLKYNYVTAPVDILSITTPGVRTLRKPHKYDLTIEGNHNFLAGNPYNGILVHNTTPGGKALAFYASIRIGLYGGKQITKKIKGKERKIGRVTSIRTIKNKVATPGPTIKATPLYNNAKYVDSIGFDRLHFLDEILIEEEIIEKSKSGTYSFKGKTLCRGAEKFSELLNEDDKLRRKLIRKAGINTLGATKKLLESISENLYPIEEINSDEYDTAEEGDE